MRQLPTTDGSEQGMGRGRMGSRYKDEADCYLPGLCRAGPEVRLLQCCSRWGSGQEASLLATIVLPALTFSPRIKLIVKVDNTKMHLSHEVLPAQSV